jgi:hypothetical protein
MVLWPQYPLTQCMIRCNYSISWTELGNELRTSRLFLSDFRAAVNYGPHSLHDVQVSRVLVIDHLGERLLVPTIFFSSWKVGTSLTYVLSV